jgi:hypothetical protein
MMFPPGTPVHASALAEDTATAIAARIVRAGLTDVLAWLGPNAPDMRTPAETAADLRAVGVPERPVPGMVAGGTIRWVRVREEGPCVWCGRWTVRYRDLGESSPVACSVSHAKQSLVVAQKDPRKARAARELKAAEAAEKERKAKCRRPDKDAYRTISEARNELAKWRRQRPDLPNTVTPYECACGWYHLGDRRKTLDYRINRAVRAGGR